jgi:protein-tyrosine-phosphatase
MASALFAAQIQGSIDPVTVSSAGIHTGGRMPSSVPEPLLSVMDTYGIDLRGHHSQALTADMLAGADLVIGMSRRHVQEAVLLDPPCWPSSFMLKELIRRGELVGPRRPHQGIASWIDQVHGDRTRESLARRSTADEVADPYGGTLDQYRSAAAELTELTAGLINLVWPDGPGRPRG